jgi:GNAT superfamily N-acetyltransferase
VIRRASPDDAARIAELSGQLGYPATEADVRTRLEDVVARRDNAVLVAHTSAGVVGWLHVYGVHTLESDAHGEIAGLVVAEAHRGHGIGAALVAAAEAWAVEAGYPDIRVRSNVVREGAHRFYEREGYAVVKRQSAFVKALGTKA